MKAHLGKLHLHGIDSIGGKWAVFGKKTQLIGPAAPLVKYVQRLEPRLGLAVVYLPQIKHSPLYDLSVGNPAVLYDAEVTVRLAILIARVVSEEHAGIFGISRSPRKRSGLHYSPIRVLLPPNPPQPDQSMP
jgi:hypothetical protein